MAHHFHSTLKLSKVIGLVPTDEESGRNTSKNPETLPNKAQEQSRKVCPSEMSDLAPKPFANLLSSEKGEH